MSSADSPSSSTNLRKLFRRVSEHSSDQPDILYKEITKQQVKEFEAEGIVLRPASRQDLEKQRVFEADLRRQWRCDKT